jgi:hypothetical protein
MILPVAPPLVQVKGRLWGVDLGWIVLFLRWRVAQGTTMAVHTFLQIDGIEGEVQAKGHEGAMVVLNWGWGFGRSRTLHTALIKRGTAGKSNVEVLTIVGT